MSLETVKKDIQNNLISPVYLWYGEDRYSLAEALKILKEVFLREDPSGCGIETYLGKEISPEEVVEASNTSSFFSRRLVIVDDIPYFNQGKGNSNSGETNRREEIESSEGSEGSNLDRLINYCQNPNPAACLVLISEKANRGRKLYKEIAKAGKVLEFTYPKGQTEWLHWVQKEAKIRGKIINASAASFLVESAGHHTGILSQELDKLCLYVGDKPEINQDDISAVSIPLIETSVFAMLDAIAAGNSSTAIHRLTEVLSQEYFLKVHTMIVRQIRLLLAGSILRQRGGTVEKLMEITGIRSSFEANKIFRQAAGFTPEKLCLAMEDCLKTELSLKSSGGNPHLLLEMMVIRFCQK
ncbi:MAG: DNA polymerase III subunit delta [Peptococcaceae bacterium]|nr:DNA polymerase III subunit delta [Peptococcaceae bacterium]